MTPKTYSIGTGHSLPVNALKVINDTHLVSGSDDFTIKLWLISNATCIRTINTGVIVKSLAILNNGYLAAGLDDTRNNIKIYDLNNGNNINTIDAHNSVVNTLAVFPNGDLASGSSDNIVKIWDMSTLALKYSNGFGANVNCLKILLNGNIVVGLVKNTNNLQIWVPGSASSLYSVTAHVGSVMALEIIENINIVTGSDDYYLKIWDQTLNQIGKFNGQSAAARALKLLPNGLLASGMGESRLSIWNISSRSWVKSLSYNHQISILSIEYTSIVNFFFLNIFLNFYKQKKWAI